MGQFFELIVEPDETEGGMRLVRITAPAFPEVLAYADDERDARRVGSKAIRDALAARVAKREPIPEPLTRQEGDGIFIQVVGLGAPMRKWQRKRR